MKINIFETDSTKNTKIEQKADSAKAKVENIRRAISIGGQLGEPPGYNAYFLLTDTGSKGLKTKISSYFKTGINKDNENDTKLGTIIGIEHKVLSLLSALELNRSYFSSTDTTKSLRNLTNTIPNGISWQNINEEEISTLESEVNEKFFGIELNLDSAKDDAKDKVRKVGFQFSNTTRTTDDDITIINNYNEIYKDSTMTKNEGIVVVTKDSLLYKILTENNTFAITKESINRLSLFYEHPFNELIKLGGGATLQHNKIDYEVRNRTNIVTDINGQVKVIIYGNQTDSTIIPISSYSESQNYSRIIDRDQINTDMLNLIIHINETKNLNNRLYFDIGFFNSDDWKLKNIFNFEAKDFNSSLQLYIGSGAFGGRLVLAEQRLPIPLALALADYIFENEALVRNVALNDEQKGIVEKYNYYELLHRLSGMFIDTNLEKIGSGSDLKFNHKLGYIVNSYGGWVGLDAYMNEKNIRIGAVIKNIVLEAYFGQKGQKGDNKYFGLEGSLNLR